MSINHRGSCFPTTYLHSIRARFGLMLIAVCVLSVFLEQRDVHAADYRITSSEVKISKNIFGFEGSLRWNIFNGKITPKLTGELTGVNARGLCARMRIDFYGGSHVFLTTKWGGQICPNGDDLHKYTVDLAPYGMNKISEVKVSIEKKTASNDWGIIASRTKRLGALHDDVLITENGFDFGGQAFENGAPKKAGDVEWTRSEGLTTPRVTGTLHITNAAGACARMQIEYFSYLTDGLLATKTGEKRCAADNQRWYEKVDLAKYSHPDIGRITIYLQTLSADGTWRPIGEAGASYIFTPSATTDTLKSGCAFYHKNC